MYLFNAYYAITAQDISSLRNKAKLSVSRRELYYGKLCKAIFEQPTRNIVKLAWAENVNEARKRRVFRCDI